MASGPSSGAGEDPPASSDTSGQVKSKLKRRRMKREGQPQLQFLIATDPSQFRTEGAKKSIRSQAMIHWRYEEDKRRRKGSQENNVVSSPFTKHTTCGEARRTEHTSQLPARTRQLACSQDPPRSALLSLQHERQQHAPSITGSDLWVVSPGSSCFVEDAGSSQWQLDATETASHSTRYQDKIHTISDSRVVDYEESERHEERQIRTLVVGLATFYNIGGHHDPFNVLPQFRSPHLNSLYLTRQCMRAFASHSTMIKWLPLMLSHPHIILSSTILASTWLDMHNRCSGDSTITAMVKTETISMINERFLNPVLRLDDATLITILHLFAGEMWVCNETALRIHETGVATLITQRGGLPSLTHNKALAEVATACCYHCDIFCEAEILPPFRDWHPVGFTSIDNQTALPESPLFCPRQTFLTVAKDVQCSQSTLDLLYDMRELTNMFVAHNTAINTIYDVDITDIKHQSFPLDDYKIRVNEIRSRLMSQPSAHTPGLLISKDWIYETCRIAALIYTNAIAMGVPFSVAADPNYIESVEAPTPFAGRNRNAPSHTTHLTEALYETLQCTDINNVWKDMPGVLYWVSAVGAAAARIPSTMNMAQQDKPEYEAYSVWVRRCLIMTATRTMIVLVFEHPTAIISAQKTLLKVQELIGSHASRRLMT